MINTEQLMTDKDKVIKALEYCRNQSGCWSDISECPWIKECREDVNSLKDACIALLKEQKSIIPWLSELMLNTNDEPIKPSEVIRRIEEGGLKRFAEEESQ